MHLTWFFLMILIQSLNQLLIQIHFQPDDEVQSISRNKDCFDSTPYSNLSTVTTTGEMGDLFTFTIWNSGVGNIGMRAVFQVEEYKFPIASPLIGWIPTKEINILLNVEALTIANENSYYLGKPGVTGDKCDISFIIPSNAPHCQYHLAFTQVDSLTNLNIKALISTDNNVYSSKIEFISFTTKGILYNDSSLIEVNKKYASTSNIEYQSGSIYGPEKILYNASVLNKEVQCQYDIRVCYETCSTCNNNTNTGEDAHNCIKCADKYAPLKTNDSNCLKLWTTHDKLYYNATEGYFKDCNEFCTTCSIEGNSVTHNCDKCKTDYSFFEGKEKGNCFPSNDNDGYYYQPIDKKYYKCHSTCSTCMLPSLLPPLLPLLLEQHNCETCKDRLSFFEGKGDTNCYPSSDNATYYLLNETENKFYKCFVSCMVCKRLGNLSNHDCDTCIANYAFYEDKGDYNCYDETGNNDGYYKGSDGKYSICYQTCKTCSTIGNAIAHKCLSCHNEFTLHDTNCIRPCNGKWITDIFGHIDCVTKCPEDKPLLVEDTKECVLTCPPNMPLHDDKQCYASCPPGTTLLHLDKCMNSCYPLTTTQVFAYIPHTVGECIDIFNEFIIDYRNINKTIQGINFTLQVYDTLTPFQAFTNISSMEFSNCEQKLREINPISLSSPIIIAKYDIHRHDMLVNQIEYDAYDSLGKKLDLAVCANITVDIISPMNNIPKELSDVANFRTKSINLFDLNHPFYSNDCYPATVQNIDIPLLNRKHYYYISICEADCELKGIEPPFLNANCLCQTKPKSIFLDRNITQMRHPLEGYTNLVLGKCYHLFLKWSNIESSKSFWLLGAINIANIIIVILYYIKGIKVIFPRLLERERKRNHQMSLRADNLENNEICKELNWSNSRIISFHQYQYQPQVITFQHLFLEIIKKKIYFLRLFYPESPFELLYLKVSHTLFCMILCFSLASVLFWDYLLSYRYFHGQWPLGLLFVNILISSVIVWITSKLLYYLISVQLLIDALFSSDKNVKNNYKNYSSHFAKTKRKIAIFVMISLGLNILGLYYSSLFSIIYKQSQITWLFISLCEIGFLEFLRMCLCFIIALMKFYGSKNKKMTAFALFLEKTL